VGILGQGVAMPAMNNLLSRWVPIRERSRSLALVYSGMYLGSVTGLAFSPGLIHKFHWPSVFFCFGSLGAFWFAAWQKNVSFFSSFNILELHYLSLCNYFGQSNIDTFFNLAISVISKTYLDEMG